MEIFTENKDKIDLVFADSGLPRKSGFEAFSEMQLLDPNVKGVFASGYFDPDVRTRMEMAGISDFIQKPYSPKMVVAQIRTILDRKDEAVKST